MRHRSIPTFLPPAFVLFAACSSPGPGPGSAPATADFLRAHMDLRVDPAVDFFDYANGAWLAANPIPASESGWGIGNVVEEQIYANLRHVVEAAAAAKAASGDLQQLGDFWATAMDEAKADRLGAEPLATALSQVDGVGDAQGALDVAFAWRAIGVSPFFRMRVAPDEKASAANALHVGQGGLGLPDRDFYFRDDAAIQHLRSEYEAHLARLLQLLARGAEESRTAAAAVMAFETALAKVSRKLEDLRDPVRNYNKMPLGELTARYTPSIAWAERLGAWRAAPDAVIVGQPEFLAALDGLLAHTDVGVLRDYLRLRLADGYAGFLSGAFAREDFRFHGQVMSGQQEERPRWKRVLDAEERAMGMVLGKRFVADYFPPAAKQRYSDMVEAVREAFRARIDRLEWMSDATKAKARQKLAAMSKKVGYPDVWKDYSQLRVGTDSYCANMMNAARWRFADNLARLGKPVDRSEWEMTPQTYNAYYNPSNNEIVLPAAIFTVPGVADAEVDDAVAYGYVGASTIGHEMTHGFDDEGRQFDAAGNLVDWWTAEDAARFEAGGKVMADQFSAYEPLPGMHINGRACLGENIADYGGLLIGFDAFAQTAQYRDGGAIGGLSPVQRFYLGYALGWMMQVREERLRQALLSDVHSPAKWRVLGPLANIPAFHAAFGVKPGAPMFRAAQQQVRIW
ncbi:MAG: M13 family metallopeptidase [Planctomycetota bacterium]